ncbi:MAG: glucokinase, partial [Actinomycetota bacterium]|nr:glucokinase [Actinomycetota bacterium]
MTEPSAAARQGTVLAIDVGGTKLAVGIVGHDGRVLERSRTPTPAGAGVEAETIWSALEKAVSALPGVERVTAVGVGCGGPMSWPAGRVSPLNIPAWREFPLRQRLQERFPDVPVRLHNDAVCFVAAEHWQGAGVGVDNMLGMVVSTGVGGGVVLG